ncbi:MAG: single-stranded-DNA-specific exonuclease RecJ [Candidatus Microsaccharimonas sp.]
MSLFDRILAARGITPETRALFLSPDYAARHDPLLLPDMDKAVARLVTAREKQEKITIYGDYDIDGLTATTLLLDAFGSFGFENVKSFIPNRFVEGYGLTVDAIERIAADGAQLIVTVDCGSLSHKEIARANELGVDVIVTDHHNVSDTPPPAIATVNPKRKDHNYPFIDLAGVGVAFKLVQALQTKLDGLELGQEKWLLDLVALGTVCDVVTLVDENRTNVYWGLKVLSQTRRPGLKALMAVAGVEPRTVNARSLGFALGPRMNAAGRLETAEYSLELLRATDGMAALTIARQLDEMNKARRAEQDKIFKEAIIQAEEYVNDPVLVVSGQNWNHGIVGIVAAKLLERYKKPTFVIEEMGEEAKGSARSYGDFSAADAIRAADDLITKGGGHKLAAGVTLPTANIPAFRERVNQFFKGQKLREQTALLLPQADADAEVTELTEALITELEQLEPFGNGNPQPIFKSSELLVMNQRKMGDNSQHVKLTLQTQTGETIDMLAFSAPNHFFVEPGEKVTVWYTVDVNEWQGRRSVEGFLKHLETSS